MSSCFLVSRDVQVTDNSRPPACIFVCGVGRSGTSLLQSMLCAHPQVACLPETSAVRRLLVTRQLENAFRQGGTELAARLLENDQRLRFLDIDWCEFINRIDVAEDSQPAKAWYVELLREELTAAKARYVLDKDPRLVEHIRWLHREFPQSHVVHVIRDPRDVLASKLAADWSKNRHWLKHVVANQVQFRAGCRHGSELPKAQYHEVVYEHLLRDPATELGRLTRRLDIPYDDSMLSFGNAAKKLVRPDEMSWKKETLGPLMTDNTQKWETKLNSLQIFVTNLACREAILRAGQPIDNVKIPIAARVLGWLLAMAVSVLGFIYTVARRRRPLPTVADR